MGAPNTDAAIVALNSVLVHAQSARRHLVGKRLALAGWHTDAEAAERDLRAARQAVDEALSLVQDMIKSSGLR